MKTTNLNPTHPMLSDISKTERTELAKKVMPTTLKLLSKYIGAHTSISKTNEVSRFDNEFKHDLTDNPAIGIKQFMELKEEITNELLEAEQKGVLESTTIQMIRDLIFKAFDFVIANSNQPNQLNSKINAS